MIFVSKKSNTPNRKAYAGSLEELQIIHKQLFVGVYDFAGEIRSANLSKGNFRFLPVIYLKEALNKIESMPDHTFDEIVAKFIEMNLAHPFADGNNRALRLWLDRQLRERIHRVIDWKKINRRIYLQAPQRSPVNNLELRTLLQHALTAPGGNVS